MHNRDFRIQKAQETLQIIEQGGYTINNVDKYKSTNQTVVFAVFDNSIDSQNITAFNKAFKD